MNILLKGTKLQIICAFGKNTPYLFVILLMFNLLKLAREVTLVRFEYFNEIFVEFDKLISNLKSVFAIKLASWSYNGLKFEKKEFFNFNGVLDS